MGKHKNTGRTPFLTRYGQLWTQKGPLGFVDVFGRKSYSKRPKKTLFYPRSYSKGPDHALEKVLTSETPGICSLSATSSDAHSTQTFVRLMSESTMPPVRIGWFIGAGRSLTTGGAAFSRPNNSASTSCVCASSTCLAPSSFPGASSCGA